MIYWMIPGSLVAAPRYHHPELIKTLLKDLRQTPTQHSFDPLLQKWNQTYGASAVPLLLQLASDSQLTDSQRYIAIMGAAKLGGSATAPMILPFLKETSWMIRTASLRALAAILNPAQENPSLIDAQTRSNLFSLLHDPALVVRLEAVQVIETLKPKGAEEALAEILQRPENYHHQIAQWVPQRVLKALETLQAQKAAPLIEPLLHHSQDPELQKAALETLQSLTGKKISPELKKLPIAEQIREWKRIIALK